MRLQIIGKNVTVTDGMESYITKKLSKLDTFLKEETPVRVIIRTVKNDQIIEVTITDKGTIRAEERSDTLYNAVDVIEEKLIRILRKRKEKAIEKHRQPREKIEEAYTDIVRKKQVEPVLMMPEDAIEEMEATDHDFYIYINKETELPEVVYRRKDGQFGIIEMTKR